MKISEMTLEQLQDYALAQDEKIKGLEDTIADKDKSIAEVNDLNKTLQKRNNDLLLKVEQKATTDDGKKEEPAPVKIKTCEELASELIKGGIIK